MGVRTAEKFLAEIRSKPNLHHRFKLMENFLLVHSKNKTSIDQAMRVFGEMAGPEESGKVCMGVP
jgi:hypothetical protein